MQRRHPDIAYSHARMAARPPSRIWLLARPLVPALCLVVVIGLLAGNELRWASNTPSTSAPLAHQTPSIAAAVAPTAVNAGTASGTCLAFDPLHGDRQQTVFIDPGHGGVDAGTSGTTSDGTTVYEKDLILSWGRLPLAG